MSVDGRLSIGELAKETGVKVVTIRYYEQIKVMPAPSRTEGNYRAYKQEHLHRLRFIRRCRDLGFTLDQIRDLLGLSTQGKQECSGIDRITAKHLKDIERKVSDLRSLRPSCAGSTGVVRERALSQIAAFWKLSHRALKGQRPLIEKRFSSMREFGSRASRRAFSFKVAAGRS